MDGVGKWLENGVVQYFCKSANMRVLPERSAMIIREIQNLEDIWKDHNHYYDDMVKFCIDRKRKVVAIDADMHIDLEYELYDDGSDNKDIFGGNIMKDPVEVVWESHPNIERNKELGIGRGRELTDQATIDELFDILKNWIR